MDRRPAQRKGSRDKFLNGLNSFESEGLWDTVDVIIAIAEDGRCCHSRFPESCDSDLRVTEQETEAEF
ncbi:MAG: hypothetical protein ACK58L_19230 [Planctomycetota bacterium]